MKRFRLVFSFDEGEMNTQNGTDWTQRRLRNKNSTGKYSYTNF